MAYYFAYGSNLDYTRMFSRCESAEVIGRTQLEGYRLVFMENNSRRIVANIERSESDYVEGVVYFISEKDLKRLDGFEGHPVVYERCKVTVQVKADVMEVYTYIMKPYCLVKQDDYYCKFTRKYGLPKGEYFSHIQRGYEMFGLNQSKLLDGYRLSRDLGRFFKKE